MSTEPILTRDEIEAILELRAPAASAAPTVRPVDLLAADRFLEDLLPLLEVGFARAAAAATRVLTTLLGVPAEVTAEATEILTGRGLYDVLGAAPALLSLRAGRGPARGYAVLATDALLTYLLVERVFGNAAPAGSAAVLDRRPTRLECRMLERNLAPLVEAIDVALEPRGAYGFRPSSVETSLEVVPGFPLDVTVVHAPFSVALDGRFASFSLAFPAPVRRFGLGTHPLAQRLEQGGRIAEVLPAVPGTVVAELGAVHLTVAALAGLHPGQVLRLDRGPGDEVAVYVEGRPKFAGIAVSDDGTLAVEITRSEP